MSKIEQILMDPYQSEDQQLHYCLFKPSRSEYGYEYR